MDRHLFHKADFIYDIIKIEKDRKSKLLGLKTEFKKIMEGYIEIPNEEIFNLFRVVEKMSKYIEFRIEKSYKQIDDL